MLENRKDKFSKSCAEIRKSPIEINEGIDEGFKKNNKNNFSDI